MACQECQKYERAWAERDALRETVATLREIIRARCGSEADD